MHSTCTGYCGGHLLTRKMCFTLRRQAWYKAWYQINRYMSRSGVGTRRVLYRNRGSQLCDMPVRPSWCL